MFSNFQPRIANIDSTFYSIVYTIYSYIFFILIVPVSRKRLKHFNNGKLSSYLLDEMVLDYRLLVRLDFQKWHVSIPARHRVMFGDQPGKKKNLFKSVRLSLNAQILEQLAPRLNL